MDLDLGSILAESGKVAGTLADASSQIATQVGLGNQALEAKARMSQEAADASSTKITAELSEVARQEAGRQAIMSRLNMDPTQAGSIIMQSAKDREEADAGLAEASAAIRDKRSINPLLNPLGWVAAQVTIGSDIENYNFYARQKNRAEQTSADAVKQTTDAFAISNAASSTVTESYIGAMKVLGAYNYNIQAVEAAAQGARWNMEGILHAATLDKDRLSVLYSANSAIMQEKQFQTSLAHLRLATAQFGLQKEEFAQRQEEFNFRKDQILEKKNEDSVVMKYITDGYFNLSGKQMDATTKTQAMVLFKSKNPDVMAMFESGLASSKITGGEGSKPVISLSPYKAADLVGTGKVTNMSPSMQQVGDQLITWRRAFENQSVQSAYPFDAKDKASKEVAFNKFVDDQKKLALQNVQPGSVFAPYPLEKVAVVNKNVGDLPVWKNVLEPAVKTGVDINDPNVAFGLVTAAMREGKLSYADASDLSMMYAAGLALNDQTRNFLAFGISGVKSYNTQISIPGTFGKTSINLADRNTYVTALNRAEAVAAQYRMTGQSNIPSPTVYNAPDMHVTTDINNFPLQAGPKSTFPGDLEDRFKKGRK